MNTRTAPRAVAFVLAALVTLVTMAGVDRLASPDHSGAAWAAAHTQTHKA